MTPFIYLTAFTRGMSPASLIWDIPASLLEGFADIRNPDDRFHGPIRLRMALANDYLVPAIQVLVQMGPEQVWSMAKQLGLASLEVPNTEAAYRLPLQGGQATLLNIAQAYGVFANQGVPAGMIFVRNDNGSHNPEEKMDLEDFMMGTEVLYHAVTAEPESAR